MEQTGPHQHRHAAPKHNFGVTGCASTKKLEDYISSLPPPARPHLELQLDKGHGGVEEDLHEIAHHMLDWEEKLSVLLRLTQVNIRDIKDKNQLKPELQR